MPRHRTRKADTSPFKLLLWTAIAGLIFGLIGFGELAEDWLRVSRNKLHTHNASGDIVLVTIDDRSIRELGSWPWPRRRSAELVDRLTDSGANQIFLDIVYDAPSNPMDDAILAQSLAKSGKVVLPARIRFGPDDGVRQDSLPLEAFRKNSEVAALSVMYNYQNATWSIPYSATIGDLQLPSMSVLLAHRETIQTGFFTPDYSIEPSSFRTISAIDVIEGRAGSLAGKDVLVGATSDLIGDIFFIPGKGRMGGLYVHAIGAETLKAGSPVNLGWIPSLLFGLGAAALGAYRKRAAGQALVLGGAAAMLLVIPIPLEANLVFVDITPGLFVVMTVAAVLSWRRWHSRGLVNAVSGLPNLSALTVNRSGRERALIAGRVLNYEEIVATLPAGNETQLVEQIIARLRVGAPDRTLYQGDGGIFAWFEEPRQPFGNHIEALYALFRSPARVNGQAIDLSVSFGVEIGSSRSLANRLASALVAADEAAHAGLKWKYYDPESIENASWKLSMLSQLDSAVDKGEVWVAFQPKLDLKSRQIIGAEALARWTHPEKGPIAASEFIAAAEQHDRIGKLTDFVLEQAIAAAAAINRRQPGFGIAVNLSARLLSDQGFTLRLSAMLARHRLPAELLTLELTETAALAGSGTAVDMLAALRGLGVSISIDDYGTGLSTLDYLKKIPASEIKIDQSFVKGLLDNRSDRVMVQSTIGLAHSLGRTVVAEGVEQQSVLEALIEMNCDVGQGYIIGRPMSLETLMKRLSASRPAKTA